MKSSLLHIMVVAMVILCSCRQDEKMLPSSQPVVPEGYISITFRVNQSEMNLVETRSVDPDGQDINSMTLFCFNAYGLFLATVDQVELTKDSDVDSNGHHTSGSYTANIPQETAIIHFVANQASGLYDNKDFVNKTEAQVMADMEGASGMMIYWYRFAKKEKDEQGNLITDDLKTQLAALEGGIKLIRNQAKVTIDDWTPDWDNTDTDPEFIVTGYVVTNIHAFGTVAPFCPEHGFAVYNWPSDHVSVTLPTKKAMMSDITDINTKSEDYIFEHENTLDNPVSVIIKGRHKGEAKDLYYRAIIMDQNTGDMIPILRNHHYQISIVGALAYGKPTFDEALNGPATNNVWVSVDSWVKEVMDNQYRLTLEKTSQVFHASDAGKAVVFNFELTDANGNPDDTFTAPEVTWLDGNNVALHERTVNYNKATGKGSINITLAPDDENTPEQRGTLMIRKGRLYRTIDVFMISTQKFTPSWIAAQVYGGAVGEKVTLKFTIPETCPESLFPFPVMISVNDLDIRAASGMKLPVRLENEANWYGEPNGLGYKYEYVVDKPGVHRLYFHSLLTHGENQTEPVTIEANFFEALTKEVSFALHHRAITVEGLMIHNENILGDGFAQDELIKYILAPQKINAPVKFSMKMLNLDDNNAPINAGTNDEFMLYSKTLDYALDADKGMYGITDYDCKFYDVDESYWKTSTNGRVMMFMPINPTKTGDEMGHYNIYMKTNRPKSEDVIRISSNQKNSDSAHPDKEGQNYEGNSYRSTIFELSNYRPFRFAARVNGEGNYKDSNETDEEEVVDEISWDYSAPGKPVEISFDVTSFKSKTDNSSVDPFGTSFEIYIDAPMLEIDQDKLVNYGLNENKLKEEDGHFVYTVDADRDTEREYSKAGTSVKNEDGTDISQEGERKTLPFLTKKITSAGKITISSNKNKVVYYDKTFKVKNNLIQGDILYDADNDGVAEEPVPANTFVAFVRKLTNTRIGSITIKEDGKYELNLRSEYEFNWTDEIEFDCKINGVAYDYKVYTANEESRNLTLEYLFSNRDVTLVEATTVINE